MTDNLSELFLPPVSWDKVCSVGFKGCSAELTSSPLPPKTAMRMCEVLLNEERKWNRKGQSLGGLAHPLTLGPFQRDWPEAGP